MALVIVVEGRIGRLFLSLTLLMLVVCVRETRVDNGECQVEQEEGADEHKGQEVHEYVHCVCLLHHALYLTPAFQSYRLKHNEKGVHCIVEIGHTKVWIIIRLAAKVTTRAAVGSTAYQIVLVNATFLDADAAELQVACH